MAGGRATPTLPSGTVTFVLADVEGSVRLWEASPDAMAEASGRFDVTVDDLVAAHHGVRPAEQGEGDSFVAVFSATHDALAFVLAVQRNLHTAPWATVLPLRVRTAVHTGPAQLRDDRNYMGAAVNRCARIRALAHGGQVLLSAASAALIVDELDGDVTLLDLGLYPLRDFERPERVFQLVAPDLPDRFPPLRGEGLAAGLPTALTTFVARETEMEALGDLIRDAPLVTLTGAGGSGKTRLVLEFARRHAATFADGVAWADAAPIADGSLLTACVASALGVREIPSEPIIETVVRETSGRNVLLIVDNCEHVIEDAARLIERLLGCGPALHIVATSREALSVAGERSFPVPVLGHEASVELFLDRARAIRPDFEVTEVAREAIDEICLRLDGIPLAIELAAPRVRVLSPRQIAEGLADLFRLLTGGARTALPRQRTLEASVDWSYRLLSEQERMLLRRLSVFAGGFTLDAVRAVCPDGGLPEGAVLDVLTGLVDKSLLQLDTDRGGDCPRYRMLETIRHFARERLADGPDAAAVRDQHLRHFLALAETVCPSLEVGEDRASLDELEADLDNLRAALDWAEERGDHESLLRMAGSLWLFWEVRCRFDEGCTRLRAALDAAPDPSRLRAQALWGLGDMSLFTLDTDTVVSAGHELMAMAEALDDPAVRARGTAELAWGACFGAYRDTAWARDAVAELLEDLSVEDEPWLHCDLRTALSVASINEGDLRASAVACEQAVRSAEATRSSAGLMRSLYFRGWTHALVGEVALAERDLGQVLALSVDLDDTFFRAIVPTGTGHAKLLAGDLPGAEDDGATAAGLGERYGNPFAEEFAVMLLALLATGRGDDDAATALLDGLTPFVETTRFTWLRAWCAGSRAVIAARAGDVTGAGALLDAAAREIGDRPFARGTLALHRGWAQRIAGDDRAAEAAFVDAADALWRAGARADLTAALDGLATSALRRGQHARAARLNAAADAERARLGVAPRDIAGLPDREADLLAVRVALGDDQFATEHDAGAAMSTAEAVRLALRGRGGRRQSTAGWENLTPTEVEVVRLVREGLTNPAIAERMLITRGTVKVHLSHIFTKLGVTSRSELAAEAASRPEPDA